MLIASERHLDIDLARWAELERYDRALAARFPQALVDRGLAAIRQWWDDEPRGIASVSWGKDSVIVAHLVAMTGLPIPLVWVRSDPFETPECEQVRDAFLAAHPAVRYEERSVALRNPKRGEPGFEEHHERGGPGQDVLAEGMPESRYVSGVRAAESRIRAISIYSRGDVTRNTCRPIGHWTGAQVFAYLHREGLPVHPAYAMSYGGMIDRQWLRVHPLCAFLPIRDQSRAIRWEDDYYGDVIERALAQRAAWRTAGDPRGGKFVVAA